MISNMKLIETKANEFFDLSEDDFIITMKYMDYKIQNICESELVQNHSSLIEAYKDIVEETSHFINHVIATDNVLAIHGAITFLIWNGYASYHQQFHYTRSNFFKDAQFINVILGQCCCRHIAGFANDILNQFKFSSRLIANNLGNIKINRKFKLPITRTCYEGHSSEVADDVDSTPMNPYDSNYLCNHLSIIFPYQDNYLIYDPTNLLVFSLRGVKAKCLFGKGQAIISPYDLIYRYGMNKNKVETYIHSLTLKKYISLKERKQIYQFLLKGVTALKENIEACEQFHRKIKEPIEYIHQYQYQLKNISRN